VHAVIALAAMLLAVPAGAGTRPRRVVVVPGWSQAPRSAPHPGQHRSGAPPNAHGDALFEVLEGRNHLSAERWPSGTCCSRRSSPSTRRWWPTAASTTRAGGSFSSRR
jgi:hypothetical protein